MGAAARVFLPSRFDAMRQVPDYCARLLAGAGIIGPKSIGLMTYFGN